MPNFKKFKQKDAAKKIIISLCVLVVLILSASFFFQFLYAPHETDVLHGLAATLHVKRELRNTNYFSWIDEKQQILPLKGSELIVGTIDVNGNTYYGTVTMDSLTLPFMQSLEQKVDTFFLKQHFTKNNMNTNLSPNMFGMMYAGYEKGDLKCFQNVYVMTDPFGTFFCGKVDTQQLALQKEFQQFFPMKYVPGKQAPVLRVTNKTNNFAYGTYSDPSEPSGYAFIAKKTDGPWQIIWQGQEIPSCKDMQKYQVPQSIYVSCWTPQ